MAPEMTSPAPKSSYTYWSHTDKRADVVLPALTSICEEVAEAVILLLTVLHLFDYSSASIVSAINNSVAKTSRSCWASDIQERTVFHDCDVGAGANSATVDVDFTRNASKVGYFSPLLLLGLRLAAAPQSDIVVQVLIEQTYYFTFRNPKYGGSSTSTVSTRSAAVESVSGVPLMAQRSDTRRLDTEGDMDDSGGLDDEDAAAAAPAARVQRSTPLSALWDRSRAPRP